MSCVPPATANGFPCSAQLPSMTPGRHTIELTSFIVETTVIESAKSAPITVNVSSGLASSALSATAPAAPANERPNLRRADLKTADGIALRVDQMADGLNAPTSIGLAPDGRLFVAERAGQVRTVRGGQLESTAALSVPDVFVAADAGGVPSLAVDPAFEKTGFIYVLDVAAGDDGPSFRLSRFREAGGVLGERAGTARSRPGCGGSADGLDRVRSGRQALRRAR